MSCLSRVWSAAVLLLALAVTAFGADNSLRDLKISLKLQDTPRITFDNLNNTTVSGTRWLMVQVSFWTTAPKGGTGFLDDVTMEGAVLAETYDSAGRAALALFTGKTRFWTISLDGRRHQAMFVLSPKLMDRYLPAGVRNLDVFLARVRFVAPGNVLLGEAYANNRKLKDSQIQAIFEQATAAGSPAIRVDGGLFSQEQSPWAMVDLDLRDQIRPESK